MFVHFPRRARQPVVKYWVPSEPFHTAYRLLLLVALRWLQRLHAIVTL